MLGCPSIPVVHMFQLVVLSCLKTLYFHSNCFLLRALFPPIGHLLFRPPMLSHRRPIACLPVALCIVAKRRKIGPQCVQKSNRNVGRRFRLVPFSTHQVHSNPQLGGRIGGSYLDIVIAAKRQIEQNFVLRAIVKSWVGFRLVQFRPLTTQPPRLGSPNS